MTITELLAPDRVLANLESGAKSDVLASLARLVEGAVPGADAATIAGALADRERLTTTALGDGIAIPHARMEGIDQVVAGFARCQEGVDFESVDGQPSRLFFVLIAPDGEAASHLKALARISRLLKSEALRERLLSLDSAEDLYRAIVDGDAAA